MPVRNITIKNLAEVAAAKARRPQVFRPTQVNGNWRMAKWSALAIARARKKAILNGQHWAWDIPDKVVEKKVPFKGRKRYLEKLDRAEEIKRCMSRMPAMIEEYRKGRKKLKEEGFLDLIRQPRATSETSRDY